MAVASGTKLGSPEIRSPVGAGGRAEVYRARDTSLGREVAIKVLPAQLASAAELKAGSGARGQSQWTVLTIPFYSVSADGKRFLMERVSQRVHQAATFITKPTAPPD